MQPLAERVDVVLKRLGGPAVQLSELARLMVESGVAVSETVLARTLAAEPARFRVLRPERALGARPPHNGSRLSSGARAHLPERGGPTVPATAWTAQTWVLPADAPEGPAQGPRRRSLRCLTASLLRLGWSIDPESRRDVAHWFALVVEAERLRAAFRALQPEVTDAGTAWSAIPRPGPKTPLTSPARRRRPGAPPARLPALRS